MIVYAVARVDRASLGRLCELLAIVATPEQADALCVDENDSYGPMELGRYYAPGTVMPCTSPRCRRQNKPVNSTV